MQYVDKVNKARRRESAKGIFSIGVITENCLAI